MATPHTVIDLAGADDDTDDDVQRAIALSLATSNAAWAPSVEPHSEDDLELQARLAEATEASVQTALQERQGIKRASMQPAEPCAAGMEAHSSRAHAPGAWAPQPDVRNGSAKRTRMAASGRPGHQQPQDSFCGSRTGQVWPAGSSWNAADDSCACAGGAVCGSSVGRVPSPGVEMHSGMSALTAGPSGVAVTMPVPQASVGGGVSPTAGEDGDTPETPRMASRVGASAIELASLRRFHRGQVVLWRDAGHVQPATVASIDARTSPLLYTLSLLHRSAHDTRGGGGTSVSTTAHDMFPRLEPGMRVWCRQHVPSGPPRDAPPGATGCTAADVGTASAHANEQEPRSGIGAPACPAAPVRTVWDEAVVAWTDMRPAVPQVGLRCQGVAGMLGSGASSGAGTANGANGAAEGVTQVPITDVELRSDVGESSNCVPKPLDITWP